MKFLIQAIKGHIVHDFSFILLESIRYNNWAHGVDEMSAEVAENNCDSYVPGYIPVGTVKFVTNYIKVHHGISLRPINIPTELMDIEFTGRKVIIGTESQAPDHDHFAKSMDTVKGFSEMLTGGEWIPKGNYQFSDLIDIKSEWRTFVFHRQMVGLNNYSGEFDIFPDVSAIKRMIEQYEKCPVAYTLDVAVADEGTFVIEVHDFYSCGFYGFSDHGKIPFMFSQWFNEAIRR